MKCLSKPSGLFRRGRTLGLPTSCPLTPQHPRAAKLRRVPDLIRRSLSSSGNYDETRKGASETDVADDCAVADSFSDITRENEWYLLHVEEGSPCARSKHAAVSRGGNVYVVGGASEHGQLGDVQLFNMEKCLWKELHPGDSEDVNSRSRELGHKNGSSKSRAPRLLEPFAGLWKGKVFVVGCEVSAPKHSLVTVHAFNLLQKTWSVLKPSGEMPQARVGYRMVQVKSMLVMFGGEDANRRIVGDVFVLDLEKLVWMPLQTTGNNPARRIYPAMACSGERYVWIYGGKSYSTFFNDIYCLDLNKLIWIEVKANGAVPTKPRAGHVGIMQEESFYIIGGENRGDEMVDTLKFDIGRRTWSVVTSVHPMSPLAHNGLSVLKVEQEGKQYLVAFGGHTILFSCQMYALLLPSDDQVVGRNSISSVESFRMNNKMSKRSLPEDKNSPLIPFSSSASQSSSSWEAGSPLPQSTPPPSADRGRGAVVAKSSTPSHKEQPRVRKLSMSGPGDFDASLPWDRTPQHDKGPTKNLKRPVSEELYQPSRLSNVSQHERSRSGELYQPSRRSNFSQHELSPTSVGDDLSFLGQQGTGNCEEDSTSTEENSQGGRFDTKMSPMAGGWGWKVLETKDPSRRNTSPHTDAPETEKWWQTIEARPLTPGRKNRAASETDVTKRQMRAVEKAIKDLQEAQKSSTAKDDDLNSALLTIKELQGEVHELRRNKEDQERRMQEKLMDMKLIMDHQSRRGKTPKIEHRYEVVRSNSATDSDQEIEAH